MSNPTSASNLTYASIPIILCYSKTIEIKKSQTEWHRYSTYIYTHEHFNWNIGLRTVGS